MTYYYTIYIVVLSMLSVELIYLLCCSVCYIYYNPQYRVFWAAFYVKQPSILKVIIKNKIKRSTDTSHHTTKQKIESKSSNNSTIGTSSNNINAKSTLFVFDYQHISSKKKSFIYYGIETISHCFLSLTYLIFIFLFIFIKMVTETIKNNNKWSEYPVFCSYVFKSYVLVIVSHYLLLIILCIPALKVELMDTILAKYKYQRMLPIISIICMMIAATLWVIQQSTVKFGIRDFEGTSNCVSVGGMGSSQEFIYFNISCYWVCISLCFLTVIVPLFVPKQMLKNLPNQKNNNNEEVLSLIITINNISRRICVSALVVIISLIINNALFWAFGTDPVIQSFVSMLNFILYVNFYFLTIFIYPDWRRRIRLKSRTNNTNYNNIDNELALAPSLGVPKLNKDVSKLYDGDVVA